MGELQDILTSLERLNRRSEEIAEMCARILSGIDAEGRTFVIHGKHFKSVTKEEAARALGVAVDTFDRWVSRGVMPQPMDPERKPGRGRKILRWDLFSCIERLRTFERR